MYRPPMCRQAFALLFFFLAAASCSGEAEFTTRYASDFAAAQRRTVSVFGVFRDGRMSGESWEQFGTKISQPFGGAACAAEYGVGFEAANPDLAAAVDDYTRDNGPSDDLLAEFAPMAQGDLILLYTVSGHPPRPDSPAAGGAASPSGPSPTSMTRGGMQSGRMGATRRGPTDTSVFELSATLYSVSQRRSVGLIALRYSGQNTDDAVAKFTAKLAAEVPATTCVGWKSDAHVDPAAIRKLTGE
jgi:hypothetical protein